MGTMGDLLMIVIDARHNSGLLVVLAVLSIFAFRKEIGEALFRPADPKVRRPRHWRRR